MKDEPRKLAAWPLAVNNLRMSAVKGLLQMTSCSNLCQPSIHSPHHVLKTFPPFLVKVTGAAQSDFGLGQLQVDKKFPLSWQGHKLHQDSLRKEE